MWWSQSYKPCLPNLLCDSSPSLRTDRYALITSPRFIAKHLSISMHKRLTTPSVVLKRLLQKDTKTDETDEEVTSLLNFRNDNDEHSLVSSCEDVKIPVAMSLETSGDWRVTSCNRSLQWDHLSSYGSLILAGVILWNPAIQEFKLLPTVSPSRMKPDCLRLGFGYDPKSNSYKVVSDYGTSLTYEMSDVEEMS